MKKITRNGEEEEVKSSLIVHFLYNTVIGRIILKLFNNKTFSNIGAWFLNTKMSSIFKNKMIKKYHIDMSLYEDIKYDNYNKFFTRRLKDENVNVCLEKDAFISPCDSKLMIIKINKDSVFNIKNTKYQLEDIINDKIIQEYKDGYLLIFRLEVTDYHHYCFIDDGKREKYHYIKGKLNTVQPIAYNHGKIFHEKAREWCLLKTKNFGDIIQVEVGALLVGKIVNNNKVSFSKGDEKGYFEFGGSTILLFVKDNIKFSDDIVKNSTIVKYGERIGQKWKMK